MTWNQLGTAESSHGDPVNEIQIFLEIAALAGLTRWVKDGKLRGGKHKDSKLVHVGHSFGSIITHGMSNAAPDLSDGIVLTAFNQVPNFFGLFMFGSDFISVKDIKGLADRYADGYLCSQSAIGLQSNFFAPGDFDDKMLSATAAGGQPAAIGELLTLASMPRRSKFKHPVLIVTGGTKLACRF